VRRESKRPPRLFPREQRKPHRLFTNETRKAPHRPNRRPDTAYDQRQKDPELHVLFDATSHHSRSRLGLPPVPPAPGRRLALQPLCWGAFFSEPDPCRCNPLDRAHAGYFHDDWNVIAPRLAQGAFFFSACNPGNNATRRGLPVSPYREHDGAHAP
jgi:hypothetical protein